MLWMLTFGAIIFIQRSNYFSEFVRLVNHNTACNTLIKWNTPLPLGGKAAQGVLFCLRIGAIWSNSIFSSFSLYLRNMIIYANISWLNACIVIVSRFLPNIMIIGWIFSTWDQLFLSYAFLSRPPLQNLYFIFPQVIFDTINTKTNGFIENWQVTSIYYKNDIEMLISRLFKKAFITSCVYCKYEDSSVTTLMLFQTHNSIASSLAFWLYFKPLFFQNLL